MKKGLYNKKSVIKSMGAIYLYFDGSALCEREGERGTSHLIEHLICKAWDEIIPELSESAIQWNAVTHDEYMGFYWIGLEHKIEEYKHHFLKILEYVPTEEEFNKEKAIVLQEYADTFSRQNCLFSNIFRKHYNRYGAIGYKDDIINFKYEDCLRVINERYRIPTMIVHFGKTKFEYNGEFKRYKRVKVSKNHQPVLECTSSFENSMIADWIDITDLEFHKAWIYLSMLDEGLKSPLVKYIREEKGLAYGVGFQNYKLGDNILAFITTTTSKPEEFREAFKYVMENSDSQLTKEWFVKVVNGFKNNILIRDSINYQTIFNYICDDKINITNEKLDNLDYEEVMRIGEVVKARFLNSATIAQCDKELIV